MPARFIMAVGTMAAERLFLTAIALFNGRLMGKMFTTARPMVGNALCPTGSVVD